MTRVNSNDQADSAVQTAPDNRLEFERLLADLSARLGTKTDDRGCTIEWALDKHSGMPVRIPSGGSRRLSAESGGTLGRAWSNQAGLRDNERMDFVARGHRLPYRF